MPPHWQAGAIRSVVSRPGSIGLRLLDDGVGPVEAAAGQKHATLAGDVVGRHLMVADFEARRLPPRLALRVELDRFSHLVAVEGELDGPGRDVFAFAV